MINEPMPHRPVERTPAAQRVIDAARAIRARADAGEVLERRHVEWAEWILRVNSP